MDSRATSRRAFAALLGLEWRRVRKQSVRIVAGSAVLLPALWFGGVVDERSMPFLLLVASFSLVFACPTHVMKDKLDGSMEFLTKLPAAASTHVLARFVTSSALAAAGSVFLALACGMVFSRPLGTSVGRIFMVSYPAACLVLTSLSCLAVALLTRYRLTQLGSLGAVVPLLGVIVVLWLFDMIFGDPMQVLLKAGASVVGRWILALSGLALCAATLVVSFVVTSTSMRNYQRERDAVDW